MRSCRVRTSRRIATSTGVAAAFTIALVGWVPAAAQVRSSAQSCMIVVNDDAYSTIEANRLDVADPGVVNNDEICGTDGLVISVTQPSHGTLSNFDDGSGGFTYFPDGTPGTDSFTYKLEDVPNSPIATVTIVVPGCCTTTIPQLTAPTVTSVPTTV